MKKLLLWVAAAGLVQVALAQEADSAAAERGRISAERDQVEASFRIQEKACYSKFAVNDCLKALRAQRRETLADLRRQEISLNDADRKRKGAERQRALEEKAAAEKRQPRPGQSAKGAAEHPQPQPGAAQKEADHAQAQATNAANAQERKRQAQLKAEEKKVEQARRAAEAAKNAKRRQEQQAQAEAHRASVNKRVAERTKPPAQPLPPPP